MSALEHAHILTLHVDQAFNGFHKDGEAERQQEDAIDERPQNLRPLPSVRVARIICALLFAQL